MRGPNIGSSLNAQYVVVLGATGNVGTEVVHQMQTLDQVENGHTHPTYPIILAGSKKILIAKTSEVRGILDNDWKQRYVSEGIDNTKGYDGIFDSITECGLRPDQVVFVDATNDGNPANLAFYKKVIRSGSQLVTVNKGSLANSTMGEFRFLTRNRKQIGYRGAVMAGGPAVKMAQNAWDTRNQITGFDGVMSGTMNDIPNSMENGLSLSNSILEAQRKGFAESDIRKDLSGFDVGVKSILLPRSGNLDAGINDLNIVPFIPQEFFQYEGEELMDEIRKRLDPEFKRKIELLQQKGMVMRYVSEIRVREDDGKVIINIGPKEVPKESDFGALKGSMNFVTMFSVLQPDGEGYRRKGAGLPVTADSARADLSELMDNITA